MADDLKQLNKRVEEAVNILKVYAGNSAQVKNMNEKQREAISKWFEVTDYAEETEKKKRAFVERERDEHGRFFKKQDDQSKKFMGMAQSVKGMFAGMTVGIGNTFKNLVSGITSHLSNLFQSIKSQFLSLFGEESEWFELLKSISDTITGFFGWFIKGFIALIRRTPAWANKMIKTLNNMYALQIKQMKMEALGGDPTKKKTGILGILGLLLFGIAAGFAGWLKARLMGLVMLWKGFKLTNIFKALKMRILGFFGKSGIGGWFTKLWKILQNVPILGKLLQGLKFGLKWLGWPITILLGIIDFIKGFAATEGTLFDKIKGGLWAALEGFVELPAKFIGWMVEKIAGWFGLEVDNVADKIMGGIRVWFDALLDFNPLAPFIDFFKGFFEAEGTFLEKIKAGFANMLTSMQAKFQKWLLPLWESIQPIIAGVANFFIDFWNSAVQWIQSKIPDWLPGGESIIEGLKSTEMSRIEPLEKTAKTPLEMANEYAAERIRKKNQKDTEDSRTQNEILKEQKKANEEAQTDRAMNNVIGMNNQQTQASPTEGEQIPDEVDNWGMTMFNYGGGMF